MSLVKNLVLPNSGRIIVISDIHANMPYFTALLEKISFSSKDTLIIAGDFLEKGENSLETLHFIMSMSEKGFCHAVCGNCDDWHLIFDPSWSYRDDEHTLRYILSKKCGLLWDMCNGCGMDLFELESFAEAKQILKDKFSREFAFLEKLPYAIETEHYIFTHAGMFPDKPLSQHSRKELNRCDALLKKDWHFDKWLIVGHWPVVLYGENIVCANPIINREKKIISIDGGCVLKDDGQLNALIIPHNGSFDFSFEAYDPFPVKTVLTDQKAGEKSYYIRWGDSDVQVLRRGEEFSRCRHVRTGYEMDILTKYLFNDEEFTNCNDSTDYVLPLRAGDKVSVIEETSLGFLVKHNGTSGWYYGELE